MNVEDYKFDGFYALTEDVLVTVSPTFYPEASNRLRSIYVWLYKVRIKNLRQHPVQLLSRYWKIYDSNSILEEVEGEGVIGQKPVLDHMEVFEYISQTRLFTSSGLMKGTYTMLDKESEKEFKVVIPTFSLDIDLLNLKFKN
ncbi:hypothetical protein OCHUTO_0628 [Orientia chuto str. Dubai]|uniref:ApaG domain-containing protein n=1 Tax=Orientia chuto str. Dubai TaxID=1359168 RepID=A0A0F3MK24_9RICK|nr:Co2+/Mg2+ efflux protein ApaG [Candidatus Orientia mediorientalis]KJV56011.1 hypothetical protein OCHUTO_0628 [Orientia chuto str. Dubai]